MNDALSMYRVIKAEHEALLAALAERERERERLRVPRGEAPLSSRVHSAMARWVRRLRSRRVRAAGLPS